MLKGKEKENKMQKGKKKNKTGNRRKKNLRGTGASIIQEMSFSFLDSVDPSEAVLLRIERGKL